MRLRKLVAGAFVALILSFLAGPQAWADTTRPIRFPNTTGQAANDLHIEFVQAATPQPHPAGPFGPFAGQSGGGTTKIDFSGGTVLNGASATITFYSTSNRIKIKKWWWTWNGAQIGKVHGEKAVAMVNLDHDALRVGEIATVSLLALADADADAAFTINYSITSPSGATFALPTVSLDVAAGLETHQQLLAGPLNEAGTWTLTFSAVDEASGEVSEGSSTVRVDSGTRRREDLALAAAQPVD